MPTVTRSTDIEAPAHVVWGILTDTGSYPGWNPFITTLQGDLQVGARLRVTISPPGSAAQTFRPRVTAVRPERQLAWLGRLGVPGLFDGAHTFTLEETSPTTTRFTQSERFAGIVVPLFRGLLASTDSGFEAMNTALAARAREHARSAD